MSSQIGFGASVLRLQILKGVEKSRRISTGLVAIRNLCFNPDHSVNIDRNSYQLLKPTPFRESRSPPTADGWFHSSHSYRIIGRLPLILITHCTSTAYIKSDDPKRSSHNTQETALQGGCLDLAAGHTAKRHENIRPEAIPYSAQFVRSWTHLIRPATLKALPHQNASPSLIQHVDIEFDRAQSRNPPRAKSEPIASAAEKRPALSAHG
jgi:hypothetical protein